MPLPILNNLRANTYEKNIQKLNKIIIAVIIILTSINYKNILHLITVGKWGFITTP